MTNQANDSKRHSDELMTAVLQMERTLKRIESLGKDVLGVLVQTYAESNPGAGTNACETSATRSNSRSIRSENNTPRGRMDLMCEDFITFREASELIPTHPSPATVSRWCSHGSRGLKLESIMIGGRRRTTRQAVERFLVACREQHWAGIHGNTADAMERAFADKGFIVKPRQDGHEGHVAPKHPRKHPEKPRS